MAFTCVLYSHEIESDLFLSLHHRRHFSPSFSCIHDAFCDCGTLEAPHRPLRVCWWFACQVPLLNVPTWGEIEYRENGRHITQDIEYISMQPHQCMRVENQRERSMSRKSMNANANQRWITQWKRREWHWNEMTDKHRCKHTTRDRIGNNNIDHENEMRIGRRVSYMQIDIIILKERVRGMRGKQQEENKRTGWVSSADSSLFSLSSFETPDSL